MAFLIITYLIICLLLSFAGKDFEDSTPSKSFVIKFFINLLLTPVLGLPIIWILNLPVDNSINKEIYKELKK